MVDAVRPLECYCGEKEYKVTNCVKGHNVCECVKCGVRYSDLLMVLREDYSIKPSVDDEAQAHDFSELLKQVQNILDEAKNPQVGVIGVHSELTYALQTALNWPIVTVDPLKDSLSSLNILFLNNALGCFINPKLALEKLSRHMQKDSYIIVHNFVTDSKVFKTLEYNCNYIQPSKTMWYFSSENINELFVQAGLKFLLRKSVGDSHEFFVAKKSNFTIKIGVPPGIGDSLWCVTKIQDIKKKDGAQEVVLCVKSTDLNRSDDFLGRFDFIDKVIYGDFPIHPDMGNKPAIFDCGVYRYLSSEKNVVGFDHLLIPNGDLEMGRRLETWLSEYETNFDIAKNWAFKQADIETGLKCSGEIGRPYCVFFLGAVAGNTNSGHNRGQLWSIADWIELGRLIHKYFDLDIVVVGAPYDVEFSKMLWKKLDAGQARYWHNWCGHTDIGETYAIAMLSHFVISYQSGIGIWSVYLGIPTAIWWRPYGNSISPQFFLSFDEKMASAWAPKAALESNMYMPLIYTKCTPKSIVVNIGKQNWLKLAPVAKFNGNVDEIFSNTKIV